MVFIVENLEVDFFFFVFQEVEGVKIRFRVEWFEKGEKFICYFFCFEQKCVDQNFFIFFIDVNGIEKFL